MSLCVDEIKKGGETMATPLSDEKKKAMIADYVELCSYRRVAEKHGVSASTVMRVCNASPDLLQLATDKKHQNTEDMLAFLDSKRDKAQSFLDACLEIMPEKLQKATLNQIATAFGIVIDKYIKVQPEEQGQQFTINIIGGDGLDE